MRGDNILRQAGRKFCVNVVYRLIWLVLAVIIMTGVMWSCSSRSYASSDYIPYGNNPPSSNTYVNSWVNGIDDYVIFQQSEYSVMAVKGNLTCDNNVISGTDVDVITYSYNYNNRSYNISTLSEFRLICNNQSLIYSNLEMGADIEGGVLREDKLQTYAIVVGMSCIMLAVVIKGLLCNG